MSDDKDIRHGRHCVFKRHVALVSVSEVSPQRVRRGRHCADFEARLIRMDGGYPPRVAVSSLVNSLKGVSSRMLRKERSEIRKRCRRGVLWSPSYFASSCGGAPVSIVRQYIEQQQRPH